MKEYTIGGKTFNFNLLEELNECDMYLIGYLSGDGSIEQGGTRTKRLSVCSVNKDTIEWIQKEYSPNSPIKSAIPINNKRNIVTTKYSHRITFSTKFSHIFEEFEILCKKEDRLCNKIPLDKMKFYLSGLIDAEGHFSYGFRKDRNRLWGNFAITHQSYILLETIKNFLESTLQITTTLIKRKDENCWDLKTSHRENIVKLIDWLYTNNITPTYKAIHAKKFKTLMQNK